MLDEDVAILVPEQDENLELISALPLRLDSLVLSHDASEEKLTVTEWYALPSKTVTSRSLLRVQANSSTGRFPEVNNIWKRRRDLQGVTLRVPIVLYPHPGGQLEEDGSYTGFSVSATEVMAQVLNFSAKFVIPRDARWGNRLSDGTWNGMVGMLLSGQADLISPLVHSPERARVMSFSSAADNPILTLLQRRQQGIGPRTNYWVFLAVFEMRAWCALFIFLALISMAMAALLSFKKQPNIFLKAIPVSAYGTLMSLLQKSSEHLDSACNQASQRSLYHSTTRAMFLTMNVTLFLAFIMYNGDITAAMTAGIPEPELNSFQDVYNSGYTLLYLKDSAEEAVLSSGPEGSPKQNVYKRRSRGMGSDTEFLQAMLTEDRVVGFNFHESYSTIGALKSNMKFCESVVIQSAFAFPLDSSLLKLFNFHLSRVREQGV